MFSLQLDIFIIICNEKMWHKSKERKDESSHHTKLRIIKPNTIISTIGSNTISTYLIKKQKHSNDSRYITITITIAPMLLYGKILPTTRSIPTSKTGKTRNRNCLMNQVNQRIPLVNPFILRVSLMRVSFSKTNS